ncbi:metal-dependent transcriptional regulator [Flavitalea flava]
MSQSFSEENYLKAIYHIGNQGPDKVSPTAIAEALGNNPASVIDMLKRLTEKNLIQYDKSKGARLTGDGQKAALSIVRNHRLWETFLHDKLGYHWDEVHEMAEQLEHIRHPDLADRLEKFLGFPEYDPHGDPIPGSNGKIPVNKSKPLTEIEKGHKVKITKVSDHSTSFLQYLHKQQIGLLDTITVKEIQDFDRSMVIESKTKKKIYLSAEAAGKIWVE